KAQRRSRHDEDKRTGRRYDNHEQGHGRTHRKRCGRCQSGLHRTRGGDFRNPKLIARVGGQGIFRHQLLCNLLRKVLIDTTLDVDFSKLIKLKLSILAHSLRSRPRSACSVSDCELTDTYSPAAIDMAPATSPATPATKTSCCVADAAAKINYD